MPTLSMLLTTLGFDGDVTRNFSDIYKSFAASSTMVFIIATKEVMVPSLACPMPLNELKAFSWAFKTKVAKPTIVNKTMHPN